MFNTRFLLNTFDPIFMRNIKKTLSKYKESMQETNTKGMSREAFVDIDEKGPVWYLGHMQLAYRELQSKVKDADFVLEIRDARVPFTTENTHLRKLIVDKPRLIIFNKAELANEDCSRLIQKFYENNGHYAIFTSAQRSWRDIVEAVQRFVVHILPAPKFKTTASIGLVVGMPNVGKSTLINALRLSHEHQFHRDDYHRSRTSETVSIVPGTTRGLKLVPLSNDPNIVLYDSPGLTLPGCFAKEAGLKLAACGIVPTNELSLSVATVTRYLFDIFMQSHTCEHLAECLHLPRMPISYDDCIAMICERSSESGLSQLGSICVEVAQKIFLFEFQAGNLGRITLDRLPKKFSINNNTLDETEQPLLLTSHDQTSTNESNTSNYNNHRGIKRNSFNERYETLDHCNDNNINNDQEFIYTHDVESDEVVDRYHDHMREVLQTLEGKLHNLNNYTMSSKIKNTYNEHSNDNVEFASETFHKKSTKYAGNTFNFTNTGKACLKNNNNNRACNYCKINADEETVISRKKGPISKTTALDEALRKHVRLSSGREEQLLKDSFL